MGKLVCPCFILVVVLGEALADKPPVAPDNPRSAPPTRGGATSRSSGLIEPRLLAACDLDRPHVADKVAGGIEVLIDLKEASALDDYAAGQPCHRRIDPDLRRDVSGHHPSRRARYRCLNVEDPDVGPVGRGRGVDLGDPESVAAGLAVDIQLLIGPALDPSSAATFRISSTTPVGDGRSCEALIVSYTVELMVAVVCKGRLPHRHRSVTSRPRGRRRTVTEPRRPRPPRGAGATGRA